MRLSPTFVRGPRRLSRAVGRLAGTGPGLVAEQIALRGIDGRLDALDERRQAVEAVTEVVRESISDGMSAWVRRLAGDIGRDGEGGRRHRRCLRARRGHRPGSRADHRRVRTVRRERSPPRRRAPGERTRHVPPCSHAGRSREGVAPRAGRDELRRTRGGRGRGWSTGTTAGIRKAVRSSTASARSTTPDDRCPTRSTQAGFRARILATSMSGMPDACWGSRAGSPPVRMLRLGGCPASRGRRCSRRPRPGSWPSGATRRSRPSCARAAGPGPVGCSRERR